MCDKSVAHIVEELAFEDSGHDLADDVHVVGIAKRHRAKDRLQRGCYEESFKNPVPGFLYCSADWKRKKEMPILAVNTSFSDTTKNKIAIFGVHFWWNDGGDVARQYWCVGVSSTITQNAFCVKASLKRALEHLSAKGVFDLHQFNYVDIWTDTGRCFQSYEFAHFICKDLPATFDVVASQNWFAERHGKQHLDGLFSAFDKYIARMVSKGAITNASDVANAVHAGYAAVKRDNDELGRTTIPFLCFVMPVQTHVDYECNELVVPSITGLSCLVGSPGGRITFREHSASPVELTIHSHVRSLDASLVLEQTEPKDQGTPIRRSRVLAEKQELLTKLMLDGDPVRPHQWHRQS